MYFPNTKQEGDPGLPSSPTEQEINDEALARSLQAKELVRTIGTTCLRMCKQELAKSKREDTTNDEEIARRLQRRYMEGSRRRNPVEHFRQPPEVQKEVESSDFEFIAFDELGKGFSEKLDAIGDGTYFVIWNGPLT